MDQDGSQHGGRVQSNDGVRGLYEEQRQRNRSEDRSQGVLEIQNIKSLVVAFIIVKEMKEWMKKKKELTLSSCYNPLKYKTEGNSQRCLFGRVKTKQMW